jgi:hypothetical protein
MKRITLISLGLVLAGLIGCNRDDDKPKKEYEFVGAGLFSCKVNGQPFDIKFPCGSSLATFEYQDMITLSASYGCPTNLESISLSLFSDGPKLEAGDYPLIPLPSESTLYPKGGGLLGL